MLLARAEEDVSDVARIASGILARRHPGTPRAYEIIVPRDLLRERLRAQRTFDAVLLSIGALALAISGI